MQQQKGRESLSRILIRSPNWVGDHVMAQSFYHALRQIFPKAHLALLCPTSLLSLNDPWCDEKIELKERKLGLSLWNQARALVGQFDLGISLPASYSAAFSLFAAKIPERVGFSQEGSGILLTKFLPWKGREAKQHKSELYLSLLSLVASTPASWQTPASPSPQAPKRIVLAPGASIPLRVWPFYEDLIPRLREKFPNFPIAVVGAAQERAWSEKIKRWNDPLIEDWIEKTSLQELVEMCEEAYFVIANDSGVAHLSGTLAQAKTLVLFGPGDPYYVLPKGRAVRAARVLDLPCSPCEKPRCHSPFGYQACLKRLTVEQVLDQLSELLAH